MEQNERMVEYRARKAEAVRQARALAILFPDGTPRERRAIIERNLRKVGIDALLAASAAQEAI